MRHQKHTVKLGRNGSHRNAMLANLVCSLIKHRRVTTTLAKAKAARPVAEKMVTLGKKGSIHHRRLAAARLHQEDAVRILFNEIAPEHQDRAGGYTRIIKLGPRRGDAAQTAILEWVEAGEGASSEAPEPALTESKGKATPDSDSGSVAEEASVETSADAQTETTGSTEDEREKKEEG